MFLKIFLLAFLVWAITPIFSAPLSVSRTETEALNTHSSHPALEERPSLHWRNHDHPSSLRSQDVPEAIHLVVRDHHSVLDVHSPKERQLEARAFEDTVDPLTNRWAGETDLVRRNIFSKIKSAFQKAGSAIKSGIQKAGNAIKSGVQRAATAVHRGVQRAASAMKTGFQRVASTVKKAASAIKHGVQRAASAVRKGIQKVGGAIKHGVHKFASAVKHGVQKAGKWIKDNGAKVAKFGLKIIATGTSVASHLAGFIPGVGKAVGKVLSGVSKAADFGASMIHANLGDKLEKGMQILDKIQHPLSGVAGKVFDAVLKRDMEETGIYERDFMEGEQLSARDLAGLLDTRSLDGQPLFERDLFDMEARSLNESLDSRSFDDEFELEARSFDDGGALEERSWDFDGDA